MFQRFPEPFISPLNQFYTSFSKGEPAILQKSILQICSSCSIPAMANLLEYNVQETPNCFHFKGLTWKTVGPPLECPNLWNPENKWIIPDLTRMLSPQKPGFADS